MSKRPCSGKTALVTSASRGVGRAVAMALGEAGAQVLVHHSRSPAAAEKVVSGIRGGGGKAMAVEVDLTSAEGPQELASRTRSIIGDRLDILVFNARTPKAGQVGEARGAALDAEIAANLRAPLRLFQGLLPVMSQGSNLVVTVERGAGGDPDPATASVHGGLEGLIDHLSPTLEQRGIRVDALLASEAPTDGPVRGRSSGHRAGQPADVARAVTALVASAAATGVTARPPTPSGHA